MLIRSPLFEEADPAAGGGGGGAPAFDPVAFKTEIVGEVNKALQGALKANKNDIAKLFEGFRAKPPNDPPPGDPPPAEPPVGGKPPIDPALNARMQQYERENAAAKAAIDALTKERDTEKASNLEKDRVAAVKDALSGVPFKDEASRQLFFDANIGKVKRDDDGNLVVETDAGLLPAKDYLKTRAESMDSLMAPIGTGGAGAKGANGLPGGRRGNWTLEDIGRIHSMKPEEQASLRAWIATQAAG